MLKKAKRLIFFRCFFQQKKKQKHKGVCIPCLNSGTSINITNSNFNNHNVEEKHLNSFFSFFIREKERKTKTVMYLKSFFFVLNNCTSKFEYEKLR